MSNLARRIVPLLKPKLFCVVPAFNESGNVETVSTEIQALALEGTDVDFVVVDDGSKDDTRARAIKSGARVVTHPYNMGIGMTVQTGFRYALEHGADYIVQVDGDGQHVPTEISKLFLAMDSSGADVVVGTRFLENHREGLRASTPLRWFAGRMLALTVKLLTGQRMTDTTSGFRLFNKRAAGFVANHYPDDYPEVEILVTLVRNGFKLAEVPVQMRARKFGQSSIDWKRSIYYMLKVLFSSFMGRLK